ncbi:MAG: amidohydrolase family protein [Bacteroidales bacterium]|nr:amidohydrolase family protein [Bacteroidales bacterium]
MSLVLKNGIYINYATLEFVKKDIIVDEQKDTLTFVEPDTYHAVVGDQVADCSGRYIMHSFGDAYMRPGLSLAPKANVFTKRQSTYFRYVSDILWKIDKCLDKDLVYASALYSAIIAAQNGTTFAICRNESSLFIENSLSLVASAFDKVGISTLQSYAACEANGYAVAEKAVDENAEFIESHQGLMGIAASYLASNELLRKVADICKEKNVGVLVNAAEDNIDQVNTMRDYRRTAVLRFYELGIMDKSATILANCNAITDDERDYIKNKPAWLAHNPCGNFQRGIKPFNSIWLDNNIMLGSDFTNCSMPEALSHAYFESLGTDYESSLTNAYNRLIAIHRYLKLNNFKGDGENNLIVFENNSPFELNSDTLIKHIVYNRSVFDIKLVIAKGKIIAKNGHTTLVDEREAFKYIAEQAKRITC